ncbi:uncharacterized protein L3040_009138 [Drepanopeziza brunnea f. sp. 'multigermtubi']|uniref:uncharacterized protein n=1 Tax=Drepanopeziza brunnea f. sp. 'multigermtubi' TaxID=698441 RepID=UPI002389906B|nr:hypothetical protein L3040_009138 [Drepanopeziza brunnea f. sp. 'multigermtubi']
MPEPRSGCRVPCGAAHPLPNWPNHCSSAAFGQSDMSSGAAQDATPEVRAEVRDVRYHADTTQPATGRVVFPFERDRNPAAHPVVGQGVQRGS